MVSWLYFSTVSPCWFHNTPANRGTFFSRRILFTQSGLLPTSTALKDRLGLGINLRSWLIMQRAHSWWLVSGLDATGKTPMYEMPLIYVFGIWGLGFWGWGEHLLYWGSGQWHFVIEVLSQDHDGSMDRSQITLPFTFYVIGKWLKVDRSLREL